MYKSNYMKKIIELKTVEKGNVLVNVNHIVSIESLDGNTSRIVLAVGECNEQHSFPYYTVSESAENIKRKLWELML